ARLVVIGSPCPPRTASFCRRWSALEWAFRPTASGPMRSLRCVVVAGLPSLIHPPIAFGHRGARAHAPENTLESFRLALRLGATGLESDVWRTADGEIVLDHDGVVRAGIRRRSIAEVRRSELPDHIPTMAELDEVG